MKKSKKETQTPQFDVEPVTALSINRSAVIEQTEIDKLLNTDFSVLDNTISDNPKFCKVVMSDNSKAIFYGDEETKVLKTSEVLNLQTLLIDKQIQFNMEILKIGKYSLQAKFNIRNQPQTISAGDYINPCIILTISGDMQHPNGFDIAGDRVICSNGLMRTEVASGVSEETLNLALAKLASDAVKFKALAEAKLQWYQVQDLKTIENICKTGFQKGWIELAHQYLALEYQHANELNKWLLYNALNKVIFEDVDSSLNYHRKKVVDNKVFELIEKL